jgi:hypothetical protein
VTIDPAVQELLDKQAIHDTMMGYCRGVDRLDIDLVAAAFHEGYDRAEQIIESSRSIDRGYHFIGNERIEVDGDQAFCEFYFISFAALERDGTGYTRARAGRYVDRWERRSGAWKIATRIMVDDWDRIDEVVERMPGTAESGLTRGSRSKDDAVYQIRSLRE